MKETISRGDQDDFKKVQSMLIQDEREIEKGCAGIGKVELTMKDLVENPHIDLRFGHDNPEFRTPTGNKIKM